MNLTEKITYMGTVIGIQEAADSFTPQHKQGVGKMYCHNVEIGVEAFGGDVALCQLCTERPTLTEFEVNDEIKFQAGKYTKDRYSIKFVEKVAKRQRANQPATYEQSYQQPSGIPHHEGPRIPVISGTAIERASSNAAHLLQMQGNVTDDRYIQLVEKLYQLYLKYMP